MGGQLGRLPPKTYGSNFFTLILYNSEISIREGHCDVHCFVTAVL